MKKCLLTVDDDIETQRLLEAYLSHKYELMQAYNGQEALDTLSTRGLPDLVILDLEMPVMDGPTFIKKMKSNPALKAIPVLYLTSNYTSRDDLEHEFEYDFLSKPFDKEDLESIIETIFYTRK
jgi:CheY-like chemotaxis protein